MPVKKNKFDQLNVVSPCSVSWQQMFGNQQQRFCGECNKTVFDFSQMTRGQIEAITFARKGQLCARITRRDDGTMVMLEPPPIQSATRRASPLAGAVVSAILGISVPATAQPSTLPAATAVLQSGQDAKKADAKTPATEGTSSVRGVVRDPQGAVIPNATVMLTAEDSRASTTTSTEGVYEFPAVAVGVYMLNVQAAGFRPSIIADITVSPAEASQVDVTLNIGAVTLGGAVAMPASTLLRLHRESDLIAIVTVGKSRLVKAENESKQFLTALNVSTLLKGDSAQRAIPFYHWVSEETSDEDNHQINPGDTLLVFLDRRKSDDHKPMDGFELSDWSRAVKKLDNAALSVYRQRIEELTPILQRGQDNNAELIEWLVRCIEEPATRWDGALELGHLTAFSPLPDQTKKEPLDEKSITAIVAQSAEKPLELEEPQSPLLSLLNEGQRGRVLNTLFSIQELRESDMELVELVRGLDDKRLLPYLVAQLHRLVPEAPELAERLVTAVAEILEDEAIEKAADHYCENADYSQDEEQEEEDNNSQKAQTPSVGAQVATARRSAMLTQFIALAEQKLHR
jgi:hypothetical protein